MAFDAIGAIGSQSHRAEDKKDIDFSGGMYMAHINTKIDDNPLSNKNLPGGLFTHPGMC